jgi:hypothetical protein
MHGFSLPAPVRWAVCLVGVWGLAGGDLWAQPDPAGPRYVQRQWTVEAGLPGNRFLELVEGADENLWAVLESGELVRAAPRTEQFRVFATAISPLPGAVTTMRRDKEALWVGISNPAAVDTALRALHARPFSAPKADAPSEDEAET